MTPRWCWVLAVFGCKARTTCCCRTAAGSSACLPTCTSEVKRHRGAPHFRRGKRKPILDPEFALRTPSSTVMKPPPKSHGQHEQVQRQRLTWLPCQTVELAPLIRPYADVIEDGELGQAVHEEASVSGNESQWIPLEQQDAELLQTGQLGDQLQQIREAVKAQVKGDKFWPKERIQRRRLGKQRPSEDRELLPWVETRIKTNCVALGNPMVQL